MTRMLLGLTGLALLLAGLGMLFLAPRDESNSALSLAGALIRVGLVLGALWLALPSIAGMLSRTPRWVLTLAVIGIVVCVVRPQLLLIVVPLGALIWFLSSRFLASPADPTILGRRQRRKRGEKTS
jgi:membrane associated rhomboid family serine protease